MAGIDLSSYSSIGTGLFVRIDVAYYKATVSATPTNQILRFSDYILPITINGEVYLGLGALASVSPTRSELRSTSQGVTVSISGIPDSSLAEIYHSRIKGSNIDIYRAVFNAQTGALLSITGNPAGRFSGIVNNFSISEDYDYDGRKASNTITLDCNSIVEVLDNKITGRKTNPKSNREIYPTDAGMDRVPTLSGSNFNFGVPK